MLLYACVCSLQLCDVVPGVLQFFEVQELFEDKWAPAVAQLHMPGGGVLTSFLQELSAALQGFRTQEVRSIEDLSKSPKYFPCAFQ